MDLGVSRLRVPPVPGVGGMLAASHLERRKREMKISDDMMCDLIGCICLAIAMVVTLIFA